MIYVTADIHYNHKNIASKSCSRWETGYRDFSSLEEMNEKILEQINRVKQNDILYIIGDVAFGSNYKMWDVLNKFKSTTVHLIYGNHDKKIKKDPNKLEVFASHQPVLDANLNGSKFFMSHYSHRVWEDSHKGVIHLWGHSHGTLPDYGLSMDVGFDTCGYGHKKYTLYTIDEILLIMSKRKQENPDHHY